MLLRWVVRTAARRPGPGARQDRLSTITTSMHLDPAPPGPPPPPPSAVHAFWDLDNKGPIWLEPEALVRRLAGTLARFGTVQAMHAYGNPASFCWVPPVERQRRKDLNRPCVHLR